MRAETIPEEKRQTPNGRDNRHRRSVRIPYGLRRSLKARMSSLRERRSATPLDNLFP